MSSTLEDLEADAYARGYRDGQAKAASGRATSEPAGQVSALGLATGSLPGLSVHLVCVWMQARADKLRAMATRAWNVGSPDACSEYTAGAQAMEDAIKDFAEDAAKEFRADAADASVRQPEENAAHQTCRGESLSP